MAWFVRDPCGIACILLAWTLMAFSQYALLTLVLLPQEDGVRKYLHIFVFELFSVLAFLAHLRTMLTDPGSVPRKTLTPELIQEISLTTPPNHVVYKCAECSSIKQDKTYHCFICKRCIRHMDHHCPWVNNCVGELNQKYFIIFILYVAILSFHALTLTVSHFFNCLEADMDSNISCPMLNKGGRPSPENLIMLVMLTFEALLFFLFTGIMFCIQIRSIRNKRLQHRHQHEQQQELA